MNTAEALVKILENNNVKYIFGHPGEQIISMYAALKDSLIEHILTRHEQGAAHAADGYARSSGKFGVCMSTAGPGAMNLVMGVTTAFKDSVPMLVITGDNIYSNQGKDNFQSMKINEIFKNITIRSFYPSNGKNAIINLKEALNILKNEPRGPVHINLAKNVLMDENIGNIIDREVNLVQNYRYSAMSQIVDKLKESKKPLILAGNGIFWGNATNELKDFVNKNNIPIVTTYHSKGIISEFEKLNLGIVGIRGTPLANYAFENSDLILVLGAKLSDRTLARVKDFKEFKSKIIDININKTKLKGDICLYGDVKKVLNDLLIDDFQKDSKWLRKIYSNQVKTIVEGTEDDSTPLRTPYAIYKILTNRKDSIIVSDAGTHTTWTLLLTKASNPGKFIFSGGFGPMGYSVPASIGVALANPSEKVLAINGDGDFQMNIQELATIKENNLNIGIFIMNNSQLGIIRQWEELYGMDSYQINLKNPNFTQIAKGYGINTLKVHTKEELNNAISKVMDSNEPFVVEIIVREENIPLPVYD
ncbi:MAG: thiamine pyrophosphate-binding protein [Methanobacteriaceae archaeon]|jgi:acetolactate synthase-1/2/3 large subunit|uniref:thiamine pyrophosphate-binding protein n=1 Tax=Methanobrevibacter TaxID=2172 RepID=UPI002A16C0BF|nr:thiamine pyrophosphate-binding protein [Methanobacteriaceae archaeon]MDD3408220.1 thiamine pyrophosphate-binding protein [Methanobacteriaceae archaeon]MDD4593772.1 thiamine pyrophosphate-binding protein [Methanobacteriaceae archaeon]